MGFNNLSFIQWAAWYISIGLVLFVMISRFAPHDPDNDPPKFIYFLVIVLLWPIPLLYRHKGGGGE